MAGVSNQRHSHAMTHELSLKDVEQLWENNNIFPLKKCPSRTGFERSHHRSAKVLVGPFFGVLGPSNPILKACELVSGGREGTITWGIFLKMGYFSKRVHFFVQKWGKF